MRNRLGSFLVNHSRRALVSAVVVVAGMLLFASVSLGAETRQPRFERIQNEEFFSTRAIIELRLELGLLATKWTAYYGTSPTGPWTQVNSEEVPKATESSDETGIAIGTPESELGSSGHDNNSALFLRGLKPGTSYDARFVAENSDGTVEEVVPFKTLPIEKPEIDDTYITSSQERTSFDKEVAVRLPDAESGFVAEIDANGAAATYSFEYAPSESGPWKAFTSGATGTISATEEYKWVDATVAGLKPETNYYVRLKASNEKGETVQSTYTSGAEEVSFFTTFTAKPSAPEANVRNVTADSAYVYTSIHPHVSETQWRLEYTTEPGNAASWSVVPGGSGAVSQAQAEATSYGDPAPGTDGVRLTSLRAATTYYVRAFAQNTCAEGCGSVTSEAVSFTTSGAPSATANAVHALRGESLLLLGSVDPNSEPSSDEQVLTLEGAPTGGSFTLSFDGRATGAAATGNTVAGSDEVTALSFSSGALVPGEVVSGPGIPTGTTVVVTRGVPGNESVTLSTPATATATGVALTASLPYDASPGAVEHALNALGAHVAVEGPDGGPYTVFFDNEDADVSEPQIEGSGLELAPVGGSVKTVTTQPGGVAYDVHYHFEYVNEKSFAEHGWAEAAQGAEQDAGSGTDTEYVGFGLPPGLTAGEMYRYRLVAQSNAPGTGLVESSEQSLTVPVAATATSESCGNEAFRAGASAHLPDCRAYEQLTPFEKEGAEEPFHYGTGLLNAVLVGEDGEHVVLEAQGTDYRKGALAGQSPFLFSREEGKGWSMLAGTPQPETGVRRDFPQAYDSDLTEVALESQYEVSTTSLSPSVEYDLGPLGGPYKTVVSVPRKYPEEAVAAEGSGWVGADGDFSKLVLMTRDHKLLGEETGTKSGSDLYEYTASGGLAQLNVSGEPAVTIGSCGARLVRGGEDRAAVTGLGSSPHSLSADGSRVFFEAVPGGKCGEPSHLYMRVDGSETLDIGAYTFVAANALGTKVLLGSKTGAREVVLYDTESQAVTPLPGLEGLLLKNEAESDVSANLDAAYFREGEALYRYDIHAARLEFLVKMSALGFNQHMSVTPDGRYAYFEATSVSGLPGGTGSNTNQTQVYRYDSEEHVVECMSCASPYDPAPKQAALLGSEVNPSISGIGPLETFVSGDGDYAFFTTPSALVREDDDGEVPILSAGEAGENGSEFADILTATSPSSDIYEWRRDGFHGCAQLDGRVALISAGHGGYQTLLLGSADEGEDVIIYTREKLVAQDQDTAGDIYDVRVGGGFPPSPPRPTECEADACSTPPAAPNDATPSSSTFTGVGNVLVEPASSKQAAKPKKKTKAKTKAAKKPAKKRGKKQAGRRASRKHVSKAKRSSRTNGRVGR